jgi:signal transduction histidine kinase
MRSRPAAPDESLDALPNAPAGMRLHPITLRFAGESAVLEPAFLQFYLRESLGSIRLALVLGAGFFAAFAPLDAYLMPEARWITWTIRFAVLAPAMLAGAALTFTRVIQRHLQPFAATLLVLGGCGIIAMIAAAPAPVGYFYYAGLILVFMYGYTYVRLRFMWAAAGSWVVVALYEATAIRAHTPLDVFVSNNFFFISANFIGMLACYMMEAAERRRFYLMCRLAGEERNVRLANQRLEQRVADRTEELAAANVELHQEMAERHRAEQERVRLEGQLRQAQKLEVVGNLAAGVAHDLNNILGGLVGYPDLLLLDLPADSPLREPILTIQDAGQRAAAVVQDLLTLARRGVAETRVCQVNDVVAEYVRSPEFQRLRQHHPHVLVETDLELEALPVLTSPIHLLKTVMNLVTNAAEATLVEGRVTVRTASRYVDTPFDGLERVPEGEYVVLSVEDTGTGIAQADLVRIFEPFFTKKRMGRSGTGLGMTVVWATVKDLGGFVDAKSEEGVGTRFDLYLPVTRLEREDEAAPRVTIDDCRGTERVLVVDDVPEQREIASRMLTKLGYRVATAGSGEDAVDHLAKHEVDLVVLDMIMDPGIDGCETYRRAVEVRPRLKAVITSGFSESDRVREVQALGAGCYLRKPYTLEQLARGVRDELSR